jgi:hypothetical protein
MHPADNTNNSLFAAWSEAERQAREAERKLYERVVAQAGLPASREDVEHVRALRERSSELLGELLAGLRDESSQLRSARGEAPGGHGGAGSPTLQ